MPRLQKSLLQKKWLGAHDILKVFEDRKSNLIEMFALDKSNEMKWKYEYKCTFSPKLCNTVISKHKQQMFVQRQMQEHLQRHIANLSRASPDDQKGFVTRNNLYKEKPRKKRKADKTSKSPQEHCKKLHVEVIPGSPGLSKTKKGGARSKGRILRKDDEKEFPNSDSIDSLNLDSYASESSSELQNDSLPKHVLLIDEMMKSYETAKYKVAKTLMGTLPKEWKDFPKLLDSCIKKVGIAKEIIKEQERENMLRAMDIYVKSHKKSEEIKCAEVFNPLTESEKKIIRSISVEEWSHLESATDEESKRKFKVYAGLLEREYFNSSIKLKECRHCKKRFTASTSLIQHIKSISGKRFWYCWDCLKNGKKVTFTRKTSCQYHILNKVGIERYRCGYDGCSSKLDHPHHMKFHIFDHQGWKAFPCKYNGCKERFSSKNNLKRHLTKHHPNLSSGMKPNMSDSESQSVKQQDKGAEIARFLEGPARLQNETNTTKEKQDDAHTENVGMLWDEEGLGENYHGDRRKDEIDHPIAGDSQNESGHSFSDLLKAIEIVEQNANLGSPQITGYENVDGVSTNSLLRNEHSDLYSAPQPRSYTNLLSVHTTSPVAPRMEALCESSSYSRRQNQTAASGYLDSSHLLSDECQKQSMLVQML